MDWTFPRYASENADAARLDEVIRRLERSAGSPPLRGTRFLFDTQQMLTATREIEAAAEGELLVGFQLAEKARREAKHYTALVDRGVRVTAFGSGPAPAEVPSMRWVDVPFDVASLEAQWFLVISQPEPLAFVAYDMAPADLFGVGGVSSPERRFAGFVTQDLRVVRELSGHLARVQMSVEGLPEIPSGVVRRVEGARSILVATDDAEGGPSAGVRRAAIRLAERTGADVVLYDRSAESYFVDPYPYADSTERTHTLGSGELHSLGRGYLADQIREAEMAEVRATAWLPRHPGPRGMAEFLSTFGGDVVVLPDSMARPSLIDRIRGEGIASWAEVLPIPVLLASPSGGLHEAATPPVRA